MDNAIFPNKFKAALAAHQVQIGCWCALANPISTEVLGLAGFDWLVLDGEHAPNDISTFIPQLMALKGSHSAPVVRVPTNEPVIIKRLLDIGFYNFLIPFVETQEEAAQAAQELAERLAQADEEEIATILGPTALPKFRGEYRYRIIVKAAEEEPLRQLVLPATERMKKERSRNVRVGLALNPTNIV